MTDNRVADLLNIEYCLNLRPECTKITPYFQGWIVGSRLTNRISSLPTVSHCVLLIQQQLSKNSYS